MNEEDTYSFGEWLKQRRKQLRLTQRELASSAFCSVPMIKKIEADERRPSLELAELLAASLKIPELDQALFIQAARGERPVDALWQLQALDQGATSTVPLHVPLPLPKPATPLVGRADEVAQIGERLAQPGCRLLTLLGPGGIGKTRLAIAAAGSQRDDFSDGLAFAPLAPITDASLIPEAIARSLRLTLSGPPAEQLLAYLRRRNMLLILDNCEQLEGDVSWLSDLLSQSPDLKLLATSRERLHLAEEWIYVVPPLDQALDLFVETAQRLKGGFELEAELPAVHRICQLVENLPLAVELAAGWTPIMPCEQIADHIQRDISILATDVRNIPDRQRTMQAVFDHSWDLLSDAQQGALMRLSVFHGGWQAEEAARVAGADLSMLRQLVDKSLVQVGAEGRFDLHELIRQYAAAKLGESGQETETRKRHFDVFLALAGNLDARQNDPSSMEVVARFDQEQDNFRTALGWGLGERQTEQTLQLIDHLGFFWIRRGYWREGVRWTGQAIEQAGDQESVPLSMALSYASTFHYVQGHFGEAETLARKAMAMARNLEEPEALITAFGTYPFASAHVEQALNSLQAGIDLIEETGELGYLLPGYYQVAASWLQSSGRNDEARVHYQKSIKLYRQIDAIDRIADPLIRLGSLALREGHLQEAYDLTVESIAAMRASGSYEAFGGWGNSLLGATQLYLGQIEAAEQSLSEALLLSDEKQHVLVKQEVLAILSEVMLARGDTASAKEHLEASLNICRTLYRQLQATQKLAGTTAALPVDVSGLSARAALVAEALGDDERATTLYSIAKSLWSKMGQDIPAQPVMARYDEAITALRGRLPENRFSNAWETGQRMPVSEAIEFLLA